jgi:hypothetical protein
MQIKKHDESYIVKLEDGSNWRIWPGDIALIGNVRFSHLADIRLTPANVRVLG